MMFLFPGTLHEALPDSHSCYEEPGRCQNVQNDDKMRDTSLSPCSHSPCQAGGTCESHDGTFTCHCPRDRAGQFCQTVLVTGESEVSGFTGQSRVSVLRPDHKTPGPRYSVSFRFKPVSGEGVLLHSGHTIIALHNGHLQFSHGDDVSSGLVLQSSQPVTLNSWHHLNIQTYHNDVLLVLEDTERLMGRYEEGKLKTLAETVHLGSLGGEEGVSLPGYTGCLSELVIAGASVSLEQDVMEKRDVVQCGEVTASLMVSDQAGTEEVIVLDEDREVRVMNRVTRKNLLEKKSELSFSLLTEDTEGRILRLGSEKSDMMSVGLTGGKLSVSLRLGSHTAENVSEMTVSRAGWVSVRLERSGGQVLVRLNRDQDIFSLNTGHGRVLRSDGYITLGGHLAGQLKNIKIKEKSVTSSDLRLL